MSATKRQFHKDLAFSMMDEIVMTYLSKVGTRFRGGPESPAFKKLVPQLEERMNATLPKFEMAVSFTLADSITDATLTEWLTIVAKDAYDPLVQATLSKIRTKLHASSVVQEAAKQLFEGLP